MATTNDLRLRFIVNRTLYFLDGPLAGRVTDDVGEWPPEKTLELATEYGEHIYELASTIGTTFETTVLGMLGLAGYRFVRRAGMPDVAIYDALEKLQAMLPNETPQRFVSDMPLCRVDNYPVRIREAVRHALWMIDECKQLVAQGRRGKAFRWLGFIQGIVWSCGICSIDQLKDTNKPQGAA